MFHFDQLLGTIRELCKAYGKVAETTITLLDQHWINFLASDEAKEFKSARIAALADSNFKVCDLFLVVSLVIDILNLIPLL